MEFIFTVVCFFLFSGGFGSWLHELDSDPERKEFLDDLCLYAEEG